MIHMRADRLTEDAELGRDNKSRRLRRYLLETYRRWGAENPDRSTPLTSLMGELEVGLMYSREQKLDGTKRLQRRPYSVRHVSNNKRWGPSAKKAGEWYDRIEVGVESFMDEWYEGQKEVKETLRLRGSGAQSRGSPRPRGGGKTARAT